MTDRVIIVTPLEDILYYQGGMMIVLAVVAAGLVGAFVYALLDSQFGRASNFQNWIVRLIPAISIAAGLLTLYAIHYASVHWL